MSTGTTSTVPQDFPTLCRQWRQFRKLSQLDLALSANVSQRHVSWLETGRSQPSRDMVVRLSDAMDIPLRERNVLLQAAGFSALYRETGLDAPTMAPILEALNQVLKHHEPLPALVVDRFWQVKKTNRPAELVLQLAGDPRELPGIFGPEGDLDMAYLTLHPRGLRQFIVNWEQAAPAFIHRLRREAMAAGDPAMRGRLATYIDLLGPVADRHPITESLLPVVPLQLDIDGLQLSLFTVISTFGTPQDITTDELRIETFYPTDAVTEQFFRNLTK